MLRWQRWSLIVLCVRSEEKLPVVHLLRLLRSRGWLAHYLRRLLADFAAGKAPSPLSAVIDAKRSEARALGLGDEGQAAA